MNKPYTGSLNSKLKQKVVASICLLNVINTYPYLSPVHLYSFVHFVCLLIASQIHLLFLQR